MLTKYINYANYPLLMDLELINWLKSGKYRIEVLQLLIKNPSIPSELAKELNIHRSSITRILNDLLNEKLISKTTRSTKTTTYFLTDKGEKIVGRYK